MDLLLWLTVGFIVIGFVVLVSLKKGMEAKVNLIVENEKSLQGNQISSKPIIWWIIGAIGWGIVSMGLMVWLFSTYS